MTTCEQCQRKNKIDSMLYNIRNLKRILDDLEHSVEGGGNWTELRNELFFLNVRSFSGDIQRMYETEVKLRGDKEKDNG